MRKAPTSRHESIVQAKMINRPHVRAGFAVRIQVLKEIGSRSSQRPSAVLDRWRRDPTWEGFGLVAGKLSSGGIRGRLARHQHLRKAGALDRVGIDDL